MSDYTTDGLTDHDMKELEMDSRGGRVRLWAVKLGLVIMLVSILLFLIVPEMPSTWFPSPEVQSGITVLSAALSVVGVFVGFWGTNWEMFRLNRPNRRN